MRNRVSKSACLLLGTWVGLLLLTPLTAAYAERPDTAYQTTDEVMSNFMSPFCPGRLLRDCPSGKASELKETIFTRAQKGENAEQIMQSLRATYGDEMLAAPEARGFGLLAWMAPAVFLALGLIALALWLLRQKSEDAP